MRLNPFFASFLLVLVVSCSKDEPADVQITEPYTSGDFKVYFAQTHVQEPSDDFFKLISNQEALIKAQIISPNQESAPQVQVILQLNGESMNIAMEGPANLPESFDSRIGKVIHSFEDSFTAIIPAEWVKPGLTAKVVAGDIERDLGTLKVGAPNVIRMQMFDVHFFAQTTGDYPEGWLEEISHKWPTSEVELQRLPNIVFSELTVPPRDNSIPAARVSSKEEYLSLTGVPFDGEQAAASQWNRALKSAAGLRGRISLFYVNIYGVASGGQAGGFAGVGNGKHLGIFHHEIGHAFSLPHWGGNAAYPYKGDMYGIPKPNPATLNDTHAGPVWAFDMRTKTFIPPTVQENVVTTKPSTLGTYKLDPMQGGGIGDQEEGFLLRHFSDYSMNKMQNYLENHIVVWNGSDYASWEDATGSYSKVQENNGVNFPVEDNVEVISVLAGVSSTTPQATIVYPPIGPYPSGIIDLFDPTLAEDRTRADEVYCPEGGCDVSVEVVQGGLTKVYMLPITIDASLSPTASDSFKSAAVNLRASNGTVTSIRLFETPDAEKNGLPETPAVLYSWSN